jgi:hypothetical protein
MKTLSTFFIACFLVSAANLKAQDTYDSVRSKHLRDSAWHELVSYDYYGWAFQWDSIYLVRWTSWTCSDINERERRANEDIYLRKRFDEISAPFPEYLKSRKAKSKIDLTERH